MEVAVQQQESAGTKGISTTCIMSLHHAHVLCTAITRPQLHHQFGGCQSRKCPLFWWRRRQHAILGLENGHKRGHNGVGTMKHTTRQALMTRISTVMRVLRRATASRKWILCHNLGRLKVRLASSTPHLTRCLGQTCTFCGLMQAIRVQARRHMCASEAWGLTRFLLDWKPSHHRRGR